MHPGVLSVHHTLYCRFVTYIHRRGWLKFGGLRMEVSGWVEPLFIMHNVYHLSLEPSSSTTHFPISTGNIPCCFPIGRNLAAILIHFENPRILFCAPVSSESSTKPSLVRWHTGRHIKRGYCWCYTVLGGKSFPSGTHPWGVERDRLLR